jgi:hypothetical protein
MKIYKNKIYLFFGLLFLFIFTNPTKIFSQTNNCINYAGFIGSFESDFDNKGRQFGFNTYFPNKDYRNLIVKFSLDPINKAEGNFSQKIEVIRENTISDLDYFNFYLSGYSILPPLSTSSYVSSYREYYPKSGDRVDISFKIKSEILSNIRYEIHIRQKPTSGIDIYSRIINPTTTSFLNFTEFNYSTTVINNIQEGNLTPFTISIRILNTSTPTTSRATFWIDDLKVYVYRLNSNNTYECLKLPQKRLSSLKFAEVFAAGRFYYDWIYFYSNLDLWDSGDYMINTLIKYHNPNFKIFVYDYPNKILYRLKPTTTNPDIYSFKNRWSLRRKYIINLDPINKIFSSSSVTTTILDYPPLTVNSPYPDYFLTTSSNRFLGHKGYYNEYKQASAIFNLSNPFVIDFFQKYIYKNFKDLSFKFFDGARMDTTNVILNRSGGGPNYQIPDDNLRRLYLLYVLYNKYDKAIQSTGKYLSSNFGYNSYFDRASHYLGFDKFLEGYMSEGFLINRNLTLKNPNNTHSEIKSYYDRFKDKKNYNVLMMYTNYSWCTDTSPTTTYLVSAMYLTNSESNYYSFEMEDRDITPGGSEEISSRGLICRTEMMYLPLGRPEYINSADEMVISTTTDGGRLYRRRYEKGLVLLNSSENNSFTYILSTSTEPFSVYKDQLGNIYNFSNRPITLNIGPQRGIILYNDNFAVE